MSQKDFKLPLRFPYPEVLKKLVTDYGYSIDYGIDMGQVFKDMYSGHPVSTDVDQTTKIEWPGNSNGRTLKATRYIPCFTSNTGKVEVPDVVLEKAQQEILTELLPYFCQMGITYQIIWTDRFDPPSNSYEITCFLRY